MTQTVLGDVKQARLLARRHVWLAVLTDENTRSLGIQFPEKAAVGEVKLLFALVTVLSLARFFHLERDGIRAGVS